MNGLNQKRLMALRETAKTPAEILNDPALGPGFFDGVGKAIAQGAVTGVAQAEGVVFSAVETAYQPVLNALENVTGEKTFNPFTPLRQQADIWAQQYKPDPLTTGMAGQVMFELSRVGTQVGVGALATAATGGTSLVAAGAGVAGVSSGRGTYKELTGKGVDPSTAANIGFVDGLTVGGGVLLPASIGYNALATPFHLTGAGMSRAGFYTANVGYGVSSNLAMGYAQRSATKDLLESAGHTTMAKQYEPLDLNAMAAEAVLGGAFAAIGARSGLPNASEQMAIDAALASRDAKHSAIDTALGVPADPSSAVAHNKALDTAIEQLLGGQPVNVSQSGVSDGLFMARPRSLEASDAARAEYLLDLPTADRYTPSDRLASLPLTNRAKLKFDAPELNEYAAQIEQQYGLPAGLINALKNAGERSNSNQVSPAGARGVMQFMPENLRKYGVTDPSDPVQMIDAAGRYLRDTMRQYGGHVDAVIADYNGGPRQAREVLAGRAPKAKETQAYLQRVRQWLGRSNNRPQAQREASGVPRAEFATDTYIGGARTSVISPEQASAAKAMDTEIAALDAERTQILSTVANEADLRQITTVRQELSDLQSQRRSITEIEPRTLAKEIQATTPRTSYKEALSMANRQRKADVAELDLRINRLEKALNTNKQANEAAQRLAKVDEQIASLRDNRAAIEAPPVIEQPLTTAVRTAFNSAQSTSPQLSFNAGARRETSLGKGNSSVNAATATKAEPSARDATSEAPSPRPQSQQTQLATESSRSFSSDPETEAGLKMLDEKGDITVPIELENGDVVNVSMRQALAEAEAELQYATPKAFNAAVVCVLTRGT